VPDGKPLEVQRSTTVNMVTTTESYLYSYLTAGVNTGLMASATLRRQVNGRAWRLVRQATYTYLRLLKKSRSCSSSTMSGAANAILDDELGFFGQFISCFQRAMGLRYHCLPARGITRPRGTAAGPAWLPPNQRRASPKPGAS
jgi:hypothetical protein